MGGRTVKELKEAMPYSEFLKWIEFVKKRGSLHSGRRIEAAAALIAATTINAAGGKAKMSDFMPHEKTAEQEELEKLSNDERMLRQFQKLKL